MKEIKIVSLAALLLLISTVLFAQKNYNDVCNVDPQTASWEDWKKCEGKTIEIIGNITKDVNQHPIGMEDISEIENKIFRTYINVGESEQFIIESKNQINCNDKVKATGVINIIDLGGEIGKNSYRNILIKAKDYSCTRS